LIRCDGRGLLTSVPASLELSDALISHVREVIAHSTRITRRSAILVDSSQHRRARDTLIPHCAWCGKVRLGGSWVRCEELPSFLADLLHDRRTHGICPDCLDEVQRQSDDAPLPPTRVVIRAAGPVAIECLSRALRDYGLRQRPNFALEATLPDAGGGAVSALLSTVSRCLGDHALEPVTIELSDRTYVLGEGPRAGEPRST
jgi:hypothetical protein